MSKNFAPVQTDAGYAAMIASKQNGVDWRIVEIAIGDGNGAGYVPTTNQAVLKNEKMRVPVVGGAEFAEGFRTEAVFSYDAEVGEFDIREIAFAMQVADEAPITWAIYSEEDLKIDIMNIGKAYVAAYNITITRGDSEKLVFLPPNDGMQAFNLDYSTGLGLAAMKNAATLIQQIIKNTPLTAGV